jgi:hypothetical protein
MFDARLWEIGFGRAFVGAFLEKVLVVIIYFLWKKKYYKKLRWTLVFFWSFSGSQSTNSRLNFKFVLGNLKIHSNKKAPKTTT